MPPKIEQQQKSPKPTLRNKNNTKLKLETTKRIGKHTSKIARLKVNYTTKPPLQETSNNTITCLKEDETKQQNTGSDTSLKRKHNPKS